jgi:hypothetical protein
MTTTSVRIAPSFQIAAPASSPLALANRSQAGKLLGVIPYWLLIAVLQSSVPLDDALAMRLYRAAFGLHQRQHDREKLTGDLASGEVRRLRKDLLIGSIAGPGFEAELDTPRGSGTVRFILTRQGLEQAAADEDRAPN